MMDLRPYQRDCIDRTREGWGEYQKQLDVLPTGAGKTIIAAHITKHAIDNGERVLFLAHREELLTQTIDKFRKAAGLWADLEKAEYRASRHVPCVVGSVQTFLARGSRWPADHFKLVIVDEAHHVLADSYQSVLAPMVAAGAKVLGITATSDRADRRNLGQFFQNIPFEISLFDLIKQGYLSRIMVKTLPLKIDLRGVKQSAGDYDANQLGDVLAPWLMRISQEIAEHAGKRRVLAFLPLINTCKAFVELCRAAGLSAEHIDGTSEDRREKLERFAAGEFQLLSNAMLLTEGFDDPGIGCIVNLRPTRSRPLYSQIVGRGTRIAPGKENLLLLDFLYMSERHNLIRPAHLVASSQDLAAEITELAEQDAEKEHGYGEGELDLDGLVSEAQAKREDKLKRELEAKTKREAQSADVMDFCLTVHAADAAEWEDEVEWHSRPPSDKQLGLIAGAGLDTKGVKSRGHASKLIDIIQTRRSLKLATWKQVKLCRRLGHAAPEHLTFEDASAFITKRIGNKKRGWTAPGVAA